MKIWVIAGFVLFSAPYAYADCTCTSAKCTVGPLEANVNSCDKIDSNSVRCTWLVNNEKLPYVCSTASSNAQNAGGAGASTEKDMSKENRGGYGGAYNTANVSTTNAVNDSVRVANTAVQNLGGTMTNNAGSAAQSKLMSTGTSQSAAQGTADTLNAAAKAQTISGMTTLAGAMTQMYRAKAHQQSVGLVNVGKERALTAAELESCGSINYEQCALRYSEALKNIALNSNLEQAKQREIAANEAIAAAGTTMAGVTALQQAAQERAQAKIALQQAAGSGFAFNPGNGAGYTDGGSAAPPTGDTGGVVAAATDTGALPSNTQLNPNLDTGGPNAPNGRLGEGGPAGGAPPSGGGGVASAAGTSPGKDDAANKDNTPQGKSSAGSYGDANGGPSGFSRAPGGPSVGMDNSFADMLKKFLPGEENGKKNGDLNYNDRMPASDAAAVIARNKNIFEEVSKRYKKKSSDGEIVF